MKNKKLGIIYSIAIVVIIIIVLIYIAQPDNISDNDGGNDVENESLERYNDIIDELAAAESNSLYHRGEYPDRADSREVNSAFIIDDYVLCNPLDGYEVEFITYEELPDITQYINKEGLNIYIFDEYLNEGYINSDGTLNTFSYKYKERLNDGVYGTESIIDNYELVAVKLGIRIKNTENQSNELFVSDFFSTESFIFLDDGKLYRNSSVYSYDSLLSTYTRPIYHSFSAWETTPENIVGTHLTLSPLEEIEGEIIYILGKSELDDVYILCSANGNGSNVIENFNSVYVQFLPFSNLKKLPTDK